MRVARESGMQAVVMWDVDTRDWTGRRPRTVYRSTLDATRGSIILMHTDKANTVEGAAPDHRHAPGARLHAGHGRAADRAARTGPGVHAPRAAGLHAGALSYLGRVPSAFGTRRTEAGLTAPPESDAIDATGATSASPAGVPVPLRR